MFIFEIPLRSSKYVTQIVLRSVLHGPFDGTSVVTINGIDTRHTERRKKFVVECRSLGDVACSSQRFSKPRIRNQKRCWHGRIHVCHSRESGYSYAKHHFKSWENWAAETARPKADGYQGAQKSVSFAVSDAQEYDRNARNKNLAGGADLLLSLTELTLGGGDRNSHVGRSAPDDVIADWCGTHRLKHLDIQVWQSGELMMAGGCFYVGLYLPIQNAAREPECNRWPKGVLLSRLTSRPKKWKSLHGVLLAPEVRTLANNRSGTWTFSRWVFDGRIHNVLKKKYGGIWHL